MPFRLFIDLEVIDYLQTLKREQRVKLLSHVRAIRDYPGNYAHHQAPHPSGHMLSVCLAGGFAISYRIDDADRQVRILKIEPRMSI